MKAVRSGSTIDARAMWLALALALLAALSYVLIAQRVLAVGDLPVAPPQTRSSISRPAATSWAAC